MRGTWGAPRPPGLGSSAPPPRPRGPRGHLPRARLGTRLCDRGARRACETVRSCEQGRGDSVLAACPLRPAVLAPGLGCSGTPGPAPGPGTLGATVALKPCPVLSLEVRQLLQAKADLETALAGLRAGETARSEREQALR